MDLQVTTRRPLLPLTCILLISCLHSVTGQLMWADHIPAFISLAENTPVGTIVASNNLTGGDGLVVVSDNSNTKVNVTSTGPHSVRFDVLLNTALDYDYGPHVVQCTISGTNAAKDQHIPLQIQILVTNVNDVTPELKNQPYSVTVPENTGQNTVVYTHIVATDPDMNDVVNYSLSTTGEDVFDITDNGSLVLRGALDFETVRFYHYIVTAEDKVGHNVSADVFITVEDVQDTPPYFTGEPFQAKVSEDQKPGDTFLTIRAADGDRGVSNNITLNIISETCNGLFKINPTSGELQLKSTADRDAGEVYNNNGICTLVVQATEDKQHQQVGGSDTATTSVTVTISDINDNGPKFAQASYSVTVDENTQQGVPINLNTPITIYDADQGTNAEFEVHVISLQDYFEVTPSRIQSSGDILIRVKNSTILDYEVTDLLTLELEATDASLQGNSSNATVMIHINNVNDNSPVFSNSTFYATVPENSPQKKYVTTVMATDADKPDGNNYGTVLYSLQGSDSSFKINPSSGEVTVNSGSLDREKKNVYYLTVVAEDGGHIKTNALLEITISDKNDEKPLFVTNDYQTSLKEGAMTFIPPVTVHATEDKQHSQVGGIHTATTSVTVTILDVDDNVPVFSRPYYNVTVDENTQPGVPINLNTPITVSDADQSRNAEFEVHVISLQDYFEVTPSRYQSSGDILIRVKNSTILDYEAVELLTLGIEVRDTSGLSNSSYALVMVHINNINDNSPVFASYSYSFIVTENSAPGITLGKITATDADKDDGINGYGTIRYRLQGSDSGFKIDAFSGILTVDTTLDRETKSLYFLNVIAEDGGHFKTSALLEVTVADVNDEVPIFVTNEYYTSLKEGALSFSQPVTLHATDNDAPNTPNSEILYTINSTLPQGLESHFGLDRDSGALTVNKALWFEELSFVHEKVGNITLIVEAKDKGIPARSSSASVVVYLQNANNQNIICGQS